MPHSPMFNMINDFYHRNLWNISRVRDAVIKGKITEEEFQEITGQTYEEE